MSCQSMSCQFICLEQKHPNVCQETCKWPRVYGHRYPYMSFIKLTKMCMDKYQSKIRVHVSISTLYRIEYRKSVDWYFVPKIVSKFL